MLIKFAIVTFFHRIISDCLTAAELTALGFVPELNGGKNDTGICKSVWTQYGRCATVDSVKNFVNNRQKEINNSTLKVMGNIAAKIKVKSVQIQSIAAKIKAAKLQANASANASARLLESIDFPEHMRETDELHNPARAARFAASRYVAAQLESIEKNGRMLEWNLALAVANAEKSIVQHEQKDEKLMDKFSKLYSGTPSDLRSDFMPSYGSKGLFGRNLEWNRAEAASSAGRSVVSSEQADARLIDSFGDLASGSANDAGEDFRPEAVTGYNQASGSITLGSLSANASAGINSSANAAVNATLNAAANAMKNVSGAVKDAMGKALGQITIKLKGKIDDKKTQAIDGIAAEMNSTAAVSGFTNKTNRDKFFKAHFKLMAGSVCVLTSGNATSVVNRASNGTIIGLKINSANVEEAFANALNLVIANCKVKNMTVTLKGGFTSDNATASLDSNDACSNLNALVACQNSPSSCSSDIKMKVFIKYFAPFSSSLGTDVDIDGFASAADSLDSVLVDSNASGSTSGGASANATVTTATKQTAQSTSSMSYTPTADGSDVDSAGANSNVSITTVESPDSSPSSLSSSHVSIVSVFAAVLLQMSLW